MDWDPAFLGLVSLPSFYVKIGVVNVKIGVKPSREGESERKSWVELSWGKGRESDPYVKHTYNEQTKKQGEQATVSHIHAAKRHRCRIGQDVHVLEC
jgi:phage protein D